MKRAARRLLAALAAALGCSLAAADVLPGFAELEAAGATIGTIRIVTHTVFDETDPLEDRPLFRLANRFHSVTRPEVVRRDLLFRSGEPLRARTIDETERLLRSRRFLYDVQIRPVALRDGVVDLEVATRDNWTFDPGISASRAGGSNASGISLREYNLLGHGIALGVGHWRNVDRTSTVFTLSAPNLRGSWATLDLALARNSDGHRRSASLVRPFHELDARWAAGISLVDDDRIDRLYESGEEVGGLRHRVQRMRAFGGWSDGLVNGQVQRWSAGIEFVDDRYAVDPDWAPPAALPPDRRVVAPFLRWEFAEDRIDRERNRNLVGRPEFFALGLAASAEIGRNLRAFGGSDDGWRLAATLARGFEPLPRDTLIVSGRLSADQLPRGWRTRVGLQAQYYLPQGPHRLTYAAISADRWTRSDPGDTLLLGGDNGLRGYPLRWQGGERRVLATLEQRFYSDVFLWQLFRVGGALFADAGRAWGGPQANADDPGWLADVGAGLRIVNARAAFADVLHIDLATPLNARGDVSRWQLILRARSTF
jgi:hypothetical protein